MGLETKVCHGKDRGGNLLHELSHAVLDPVNFDYALGWNAIQGISPDQRKRNADTYEYFAQAAKLNCPA